MIMDCSTGWLLDVSIEQNRATIWMKTIEGNILRLIDAYQIEPTSKVEVEYDKNESILIKITKIDDLAASPPSFSILYFEIHAAPSLYYLGPDDVNDPTTQIRARYQEEPEISFEGSEDSILKDFSEYVLAKDPDILVSTDQHSRSTILDYLFMRIRGLGLDLQLGRDKKTNKTNKIEGMVYLSSKSFHSDLDLAGLIERARFGFLPLSLTAHYGMNRLIDSRNCYELVQRGFAIPRSSNNHERIRTLDEIIAKDKGGMIFSPKIGLHENVAVLDYENEYANLILKHNLSYETVTSLEDGRIITNRKDKPGLLPTVLEYVLKRRIIFRNLQNSFVVNTNDWLWCEQRIVALKSILVCLYGTTGSFWNRFANVAAFEEINRLSRDVLIKTKDIVQGLRFELVYADTDSVFLKKGDASLEDFENVKDVLARETGLPISFENYYKFLVLLPLEADEKMESLKHYFGITQTSELIPRGIEIRRHDAPNFIKEFQTELLYTLFDCKDSAEVLSKGFENALLLVTKTIDNVMTSKIPLKDLVVSKMLRHDLTKYRSLFPHVSAALQLTEAGKSLVRGDMVQYIYTNAVHKNPLRRVMPLDLLSEEPDYDKEKYRDMLLEATESILGYFGFDRMVYGDRKKNRKWWHELNEQRRKDVETERYGHDG